MYSVSHKNWPSTFYYISFVIIAIISRNSETNFDTDYVLMWLSQYFVFQKSILKYVFDILVIEILMRKYLVFWYLKYFLKSYI